MDKKRAVKFQKKSLSTDGSWLVNVFGDVKYIYILSGIVFLVGFVFLLFAESVIIKQTAIITLGGMLGFLLFLYITQ
jgi:hypothetical protein